MTQSFGDILRKEMLILSEKNGMIGDYGWDIFLLSKVTETEYEFLTYQEDRTFI